MPFFEVPLLAPGDRVWLECRAVPELCVSRSVGTDGTIDLPLIGPIAAVRQTPEALARTIERHLPSGIKPTKVQVRLMRSSVNMVLISGQVKRRLSLYAPNGIARDTLLAAAQPLPGSDVAVLALPDRILPGTQIDVPALSAERRIQVLGGVNNAMELSPVAGMTLADALNEAGGIAGHGDPSQVVVVRRGESFPMDATKDRSFRILPGDSIRVGLLADRKFVVVKGLVARPGTIEYAPNMTAKQALAAAGDLLEAGRKGTLVWQTGPKTYRLSIPFLLEGRIPDPRIAPSDTLIVESTRP